MTANGAVAALAVALFVFSGMAPTVGDIGSCGQPPDDLDATTFFGIKAGTDCDQCRECGLTRTSAATNACNPPFARRLAFRPAVSPSCTMARCACARCIHASCDDYASYMSETAATAPSECQFCPAP